MNKSRCVCPAKYNENEKSIENRYVVKIINAQESAKNRNRKSQGVMDKTPYFYFFKICKKYIFVKFLLIKLSANLQETVAFCRYGKESDEYA